MQEFPKALYLHGELRTVADKADEAAARKEGYDDWQDDHDRQNKPKAKAKAAE